MDMRYKRLNTRNINVLCFQYDIAGSLVTAKSPWSNCNMFHNGRIVIFTSYFLKNNVNLIFHDIFHKETVIVPLEKKCDQIRKLDVINDEYLLLKTDTCLLVLKTNTILTKISFVLKAKLNLGISSIIMGQSNNYNFLIYNQHEFVAGELKNEELLLSQVQRFDFNNLRWPKLTKNRLFCFRILHARDNNNYRFEFLKINVVTLETEERSEVSFTVSVNYDAPIFSASSLFLFQFPI
jgi:hypothetical protein